MKSAGTTQKPVECMKRPIENNSSPGQAVYDPFVGSGTTIIAAEMTGRCCHAIELSPAYIDVAVTRWQNFTGQTATRETGENHLAEVRRRKLKEIDKVEREVRARLTREINYWDARAARLREEERAGKEQRVNASNAEATAQRLVERLHKRQSELERERQITALPPVLKGAALVIPRGLLQSRLPQIDLPKPFGFSEDPAARAVVEQLAMDAVMAAERMLGNAPKDVSAEKKGWDIESRDPRLGHLRFIEVKGRHAEACDVIITKNEILASLNAPESFILALVRVESGFAHEPIYVQRFFKRELGFAETAVVFNIDDLLSIGAQASRLRHAGVTSAPDSY
jgi:Domain of unknown function (DUF3883)/DNA methylase